MSAEAAFLAQDLKRWTGRCASWLSEWRHWLVEAGLALCGPQCCRVRNDLTAGEVSSVLQIHVDKKWFTSIYDFTAKSTIWHFSISVIVTKKGRSVVNHSVAVCEGRHSSMSHRKQGHWHTKETFIRAGKKTYWASVVEGRVWWRLITQPMKLWPFEKKKKSKIIK